MYLGGKFHIGKAIAQVVAPRGIFWEPFCGGLNVSRHLAAYGPGVVSDACAPLIALYQGVRAGWVPPSSVTREQWQAAKSLPDSDPMKAFCGFGVSFGGKWFGGYVADRKLSDGATRRAARAASWGLVSDLRAMTSCVLARLSFFDVHPDTSPTQPECIYADPPYEGTTGYGAVEPFNHALFWAYCWRWAQRGVRVFVSEYNAGAVPVRVVWEQERERRLGGTQGSRTAVERLFQVAA